MRRLRNVKQVGYQATHQIACLVTVVIREAHALVGVKQVFSHLAFHTRAHDVSPANNKIATQKVDKVHDHKTNSNEHQTAKNGIFALRKQSLCERSQNLRERQLNAGQNDGADSVQNKQMLLRSVIRKKTGKQRFAVFARGVVSRVSKAVSARG